MRACFAQLRKPMCRYGVAGAEIVAAVMSPLLCRGQSKVLSLLWQAISGTKPARELPTPAAHTGKSPLSNRLTKSRP